MSSPQDTSTFALTPNTQEQERAAVAVVWERCPDDAPLILEALGLEEPR